MMLTEEQSLEAQAVCGMCDGRGENPLLFEGEPVVVESFQIGVGWIREERPTVRFEFVVCPCQFVTDPYGVERPIRGF